jgi:acetoin utilization deacetylase AcuC-like enzyme
MALLLIHTDRFAEHQTPPGHPERPERAEVMDVVADRWRARGVDVVAPRAATRE